MITMEHHGGTDLAARSARPQVHVRAPGRRRLLATIALMLALALGSTILTAPAASASTWSHRYGNTSIVFGWDNDHAWVISNYADAITYGGAVVAGQLCAVIARQESSAMSRVCSTAARPVLDSLVRGRPRLSNHGVWAAFYPWRWGHLDKGTW